MQSSRSITWVFFFSPAIASAGQALAQEPQPVHSSAFTLASKALVAKALRNAHRYEQLLKRGAPETEEERRDDLRRMAVLGFLRRLMHTYSGDDDERMLSKSSGEELDRLVEIAMAVFSEESKTG